MFRCNETDGNQIPNDYLLLLTAIISDQQAYTFDVLSSKLSPITSELAVFYRRYYHMFFGEQKDGKNGEGAIKTEATTLREWEDAFYMKAQDKFNNGVIKPEVVPFARPDGTVGHRKEDKVVVKGHGKGAFSKRSITDNFMYTLINVVFPLVYKQAQPILKEPPYGYSENNGIKKYYSTFVNDFIMRLRCAIDEVLLCTSSTKSILEILYDKAVDMPHTGLACNMMLSQHQLQIFNTRKESLTSIAGFLKSRKIKADLTDKLDIVAMLAGVFRRLSEEWVSEYIKGQGISSTVIDAEGALQFGYELEENTYAEKRPLTNISNFSDIMNDIEDGGVLFDFGSVNKSEGVEDDSVADKRKCTLLRWAQAFERSKYTLQLKDTPLEGSLSSLLISIDDIEWISTPGNTAYAQKKMRRINDILTRIYTTPFHNKEEIEKFISDEMVIVREEFNDPSRREDGISPYQYTKYQTEEYVFYNNRRKLLKTIRGLQAVKCLKEQLEMYGYSFLALPHRTPPEGTPNRENHLLTNVGIKEYLEDIFKDTDFIGEDTSGPKPSALMPDGDFISGVQPYSENILGYLTNRRGSSGIDIFNIASNKLCMTPESRVESKLLLALKSNNIQLETTSTKTFNSAKEAIITSLSEGCERALEKIATPIIYDNSSPEDNRKSEAENLKLTTVNRLAKPLTSSLSSDELIEYNKCFTNYDIRDVLVLYRQLLNSSKSPAVAWTTLSVKYWGATFNVVRFLTKIIAHISLLTGLTKYSDEEKYNTNPKTPMMSTWKKKVVDENGRESATPVRGKAPLIRTPKDGTIYMRGRGCYAKYKQYTCEQLNEELGTSLTQEEFNILKAGNFSDLFINETLNNSPAFAKLKFSSKAVHRREGQPDARVSIGRSTVFNNATYKECARDLAYAIPFLTLLDERLEKSYNSAVEEEQLTMYEVMQILCDDLRDILTIVPGTLPKPNEPNYLQRMITLAINLSVVTKKMVYLLHRIKEDIPKQTIETSATPTESTNRTLGTMLYSMSHILDNKLTTTTSGLRRLEQYKTIYQGFINTPIEPLTVNSCSRLLFRNTQGGQACGFYMGAPMTYRDTSLIVAPEYQSLVMMQDIVTGITEPRAVKDNLEMFAFLTDFIVFMSASHHNFPVLFKEFTTYKNLVKAMNTIMSVFTESDEHDFYIKSDTLTDISYSMRKDIVEGINHLTKDKIDRNRSTSLTWLTNLELYCSSYAGIKPIPQEKLNVMKVETGMHGRFTVDADGLVMKGANILCKEVDRGTHKEIIIVTRYGLVSYNIGTKTVAMCTEMEDWDWL